ncbi:ABC-type transport auxiliary lipoprotein family protein [Arenimonas sp.]|uniref:ABC-type transport auxiliary lipoprotein family protein n=1 Tax=Arenimonas sp. TaxID=1872635 RepID=UPI0039E680FF
MSARRFPRSASSARRADIGTRMKRTFSAVALGLAAALMLPGCSMVGGSKNVTLYSPQLKIDAQASWPTVNWPLVVARPLSSDSLDSMQIAVRPQSDTLQVYQGAVWSDAVPDLVQSELVRAFEDSGKIVAVGRQSTGVRGDFVLMTDIRQFESVYREEGKPPTVVVSIQAKLLAHPNTRVLAMRRFDVEVPAASEEIPSVVAAFNAALTQVNGDIIGWTLATGQANVSAAKPKS